MLSRFASLLARKLRVQYPGAIYHVMNRGDRHEPIFRDDGDRILFLNTLEEASRKTGWQVHSWCLMRNHLHLGKGLIILSSPRQASAVGS